MGPVRVGIRYCGGCKPYFDRVALVEEVASRLRGRFLFLRHVEKDLAGLIVVNGCPRACASRDAESPSPPWYSIAEEDGIGGLLEWLSAFVRDRGQG